MSPAKSDDPITKITLNLYTEDVEFFKSYYGHGWSEQVRQLVHAHKITTAGYRTLRKTLGDFK